MEVEDKIFKLIDIRPGDSDDCDDCCVLVTFWKTSSKEDFEKWINSCFDNPDFLDHGYMAYWERYIEED